MRRRRAGWTLTTAVVLAVGAPALAGGCGADGAVRSGSAVAAPGATTSTVPITSTVPTSAPTSSSPAPTGSTTTTGVPPTPGTTAPPAPQTPGDGLGDEPFPALGNPGIDVTHYDLDLHWDGAARELAGTVGIDLVATEDRTAFTLDADAALDVSAVTVDGAAAAFSHQPPELRITPPVPLTAGAAARVVVTYDTRPEAASGVNGLDGGWLTTDLGSYTLDEPDLTRTWLPCNDHPSDKATWRFSVTAPGETTVVANGTLVSQPATDAGPWVWEMDEPMATYLVQILTGPYQIIAGTGPAGVSLSSAVLPEDLGAVQPYLDQMAPMIDYFDDLFGPYPFASYGLAVTDSIPGLAMEHQTRSLFPRDLFSRVDDRELQFFLSHELAHQWFGDAVSPASWQDVWLNESFATYGQWLWSDHIGQQPLDAAADNALTERREVAPDQPGTELFGNEVYDGGAVVLHALRRTIGDDAFFSLLQQWVSRNEGGSRTTADFEALAAQVSGRSLTDFFDTWLSTTDPPDRYP